MGEAKDEGAERVRNVGIPLSMAQRLARYAERHGLNQKDVLRQLVGWFLDADPLVQRVARRDVDFLMRSAYADALAKMAEDVRTGGKPDEPFDPSTIIRDPEGNLRREKGEAGSGGHAAKRRRG